MNWQSFFGKIFHIIFNINNFFIIILLLCEFFIPGFVVNNFYFIIFIIISFLCLILVKFLYINFIELKKSKVFLIFYILLGVFLFKLMMNTNIVHYKFLISFLFSLVYIFFVVLFFKENNVSNK